MNESIPKNPAACGESPSAAMNDSSSMDSCGVFAFSVRYSYWLSC